MLNYTQATWDLGSYVYEKEAVPFGDLEIL